MTDTQLDDSAKKENSEKTTEGKVEELKSKDKPEETLEKESAEVEATVDQQDEASESEAKDPVLGLEKERDLFKEKYYYIAAELENVRRRFDREKQNLVKFGNEKILSNLLTVVDNLELTLLAVSNEEDEKIKNIVAGIQMVKDQFIETLKQNGLELIEAKGEKFDPKFHEAIGQKEVEGTEPGIVAEEVQKGYVLNGRVLRASKVIISK